MNHIAKYACVAGGKRAASECASEGDEVSVELRHKSRAPAPKARRYAGRQRRAAKVVERILFQHYDIERRQGILMDSSSLCVML